MKPTARGFSLVELLLVLAIAAVVSTFAYSGYQSVVLKARRVEARSALLALLNQQEQFFTGHQRYAEFDAGESRGEAIAFKTYAGDRRENASHLLGAQACTDIALTLCVKVFAVPVAGDAAAGTLQAQSNGVRDCTGPDVRSCWK